MFHESPEFIKHLDRWLDMSEQEVLIASGIKITPVETELWF